MRISGEEHERLKALAATYKVTEAALVRLAVDTFATERGDGYVFGPTGKLKDQVNG